MTREPEPVTVAQVVRRTVEIVDPENEDAAVGELTRRLEDDDEPITAVNQLDKRLATAAEAVDVDIEDPAVSMAVAVVLYLAHRRDEIDGAPDDVLRLAARAEWHGDPPHAVTDWLSARGVAA